MSSDAGDAGDALLAALEEMDKLVAIVAGIKTKFMNAGFQEQMAEELAATSFKMLLSQAQQGVTRK